MDHKIFLYVFSQFQLLANSFENLNEFEQETSKLAIKRIYEK